MSLHLFDRFLTNIDPSSPSTRWNHLNHISTMFPDRKSRSDCAAVRTLWVGRNFYLWLFSCWVKPACEALQHSSHSLSSCCQALLGTSRTLWLPPRLTVTNLPSQTQRNLSKLKIRLSRGWIVSRTQHARISSLIVVDFVKNVILIILDSKPQDHSISMR